MRSAPQASLQARLDALYARRAAGIKLGLDVVEALLEDLGRPQDALAPLHVAGTNGKGSVCAMLDAVLRAAGLRPALYTSPHLVRFNERIRVDGRCIEDATLLALLEEIDGMASAIARRPGLREPTFFEFTTAAALTWFQRAGARLAVLETGLGGRLDATNIVNPLLVVLTSMARDHTAYLGNTLAKIAGEKAGIIKQGRPVICGHMRDPAREVVQAVARERRAPLIDVREAVSVRRLDESLDGQRVKIETAAVTYRPFTLPLLGRHQLENLAAAAAAIDVMNELGIPGLDEATVRRGLEQVSWPARLQVLQKDPPVILDAAHNPAGAKVLAAALERLLPGRPVGLVCGMASDKDLAGFMNRLGRTAGRCWAVPLSTPRGRPPEAVRAAAETAGIRAETADDPASAIDRAVEWAGGCEGAVLITGSIYLAGDVLAARGLAPV